MAEFRKAYKILIQLEYAKKPDSFLHLNNGETGLTIAGVYQKWHKSTIDWDFIQRIIDMCNGDVKRASKLLYMDKQLHTQIITVFKKEYWDSNRLNDITSQQIANEIFISATNIGNKEAVKMAQRIVKTKEDGAIGAFTVKALNLVDEIAFSLVYDEMEKKKYYSIVSNNPKLAKNLRGWIYRAEAV